MNLVNEIRIVGTRELAQALRTPRSVLLLLLFLLFLGSSLLVVNVISAKALAAVTSNTPAGTDPAQVTEAIAKQKTKFLVAFVTDGDEAYATSLAALPLLLLFVFKLSTRFLPLFLAVLGFDQISSETSTRSIRYLSARARRRSIVLGKFFSSWVLAFGLCAVAALMMTGATVALVEDFAAVDASLWFLRLWVAMGALCLAYSALTTLCSTLVATPILSLIVNLLLLFAIWLLAFVGDAQGYGTEATSSGLAWMRYLSVWHYSGSLLQPALADFAVALAAHLGFAALLLGGAILAADRSDW